MTTTPRPWRRGALRATAWLYERLHGKTPAKFLRVAYEQPRVVVLITAGGPSADNVWPIDWHGPLSLDPELYGITLKQGGYGETLVREHGEFVVNFVPRAWEPKILAAGASSGRGVDKFAHVGIERAKAVQVAAPRVAEATGWIECRVTGALDVGSHRLFVGRVLHAHRDAEDPPLAHRISP